MRVQFQRVSTGIQYQPEMKKLYRQSAKRHAASIGVDSETGYIYLVVESSEDAMYYTLLGDEGIKRELGI